MFGGNDPTPPDQLVNKVVGLRTQIYQMNQALGVPDQMPTLNGKTYKHPYDALPMILELWPANAASMTITIGLAIGPALTATAAQHAEMPLCCD